MSDINLDDGDSSRYSPYHEFSIEQWSVLRRNTPLTLTSSELAELRGVNERVSLEEVEQVYLPLSRLLSYYVSSLQLLNTGTQSFMGIETAKVPFVIAVSGSVAVGKSTVSRILQRLLARWPEHPKVDLISTDGFLLPTAELQARNLMERKGFPESYDRLALLRFLSDVKGGRRHLKAPLYSHLSYDIIPDKYALVDQPDILIVEGLNVLQTGKLDSMEKLGYVSDYFDFSIYVDADPADLEKWYVNRFLQLRHSVFNKPGAYFSHYAGLSEGESLKTARKIWRDINQVNLESNILPTRERAKLILKKSREHKMESVRLRKL